MNALCYELRLFYLSIVPDERCGEVGREPLRGDELLELPLERDLGAVLAHRPVVNQQKVRVVLVQAHEP